MVRSLVFTVIAALAAAVLVVTPAGAVTCPAAVGTWTGDAGSFVWEDAENWYLDTIPEATTAVCIPDSKHVVLRSVTTVKSLVVGASSTFSLQAQGCVTEAKLEATDVVRIPVNATVVLDSDDACGGADAVLRSPTITNRGTISSQRTGGGGGRRLWGHLTNYGTVNINHGTEFDLGGFTNLGAVNIGSGVVFDINYPNGFLNTTGGVITTSGSGEFRVLGGYLEQREGVVTSGSNVNLIDALLYFTGTGAGAFTSIGTRSKIAGNTAAAQRVRVLAQGCVSGATLWTVGAVVNRGTITLTSDTACGGAPAQLVVDDEYPLTNHGTIRTTATGGERLIAGDIVNDGGTLATGGVTHLASTADIVSAFTNRGTLIGPADLRLRGGSVFVNATGGWITNDVHVDSGDRFVQRAGTVSGLVAVFGGGSLTFAGAGEGSFMAFGTVELAGHIAPGQQLSISGLGCVAPGTANAIGSFTNAGQIMLTATSDCGGAPASLVLPPGGTLTNDGRIFTRATPGAGERRIVGNVINRGLIRTASNPVSIDGNFTQTLGGTLRVVLDDPVDTPLAISGSAGLDGLLSVDMVGTPLFGHEYDAVSFASRAGRFASIAGNGMTYFTRYSQAKLVLVPVSAPVINNYTPGSGVVGQRIVIEGDGFTSASAVTFPKVGGGRVAARFTILNDDQIRTTIPANAASGGIRVTNSVGAITGPNFRVKPNVTSLSPTSGPVGTMVTITGTSFTGARAVRFDTVQATDVTVVDDRNITARVPAGATTGRVTVVTPSGSGQSPIDFTVT